MPSAAAEDRACPRDADRDAGTEERTETEAQVQRGVDGAAVRARDVAGAGAVVVEQHLATDGDVVGDEALDAGREVTRQAHHRGVALFVGGQDAERTQIDLPDAAADLGDATAIILIADELVGVNAGGDQNKREANESSHTRR